MPVEFDWGYFPRTVPSFPQELTDKLQELTGVPGFLGNCHASGTEIINQLGDEHVATGKPILYTSADSVLQIAAHEEHFGLERLYAMCEAAYELVKPYNIGRVIARPFLGENGNYRRTSNRHDYAVPPPAPTLLDHVKDEGGEVIAPRQDQRHLRGAGRIARGQGRRQHGAVRRAAEGGRRSGRQVAHVRQLRRLRHACSATAATSPATRTRCTNSTRACRNSWPS